MMLRKVGILGMGHVGAHVASALMQQNLCDEIIAIDIDEKKAAAQATDLADTACYYGSFTRIVPGTYKDLADAQILVICFCGQIFDENRLEELDGCIHILKDILPQLKASAFHGIIVSITNPCDLIALYLHLHLKLTVIGTGTALDSSRFRVRIADALHLSPLSVEAYCVGEHGDSQVPLWSQVRVSGHTLDELQKREPEKYALDRSFIEQITIHAGWDIVNGKGSTEFGIGSTAARIIHALFADTRELIPCSSLYVLPDGSEIYTSLPRIIGAEGVLETLTPDMTESEKERFDKSCQLLQTYRDTFQNIK